MFRRPPDRPDTSALELLGLDRVLRRDELEGLARHTDTVGVPAGAVLCRPGEYPRQYVAVLDGYVEIGDPTASVCIGGPGTRIGAHELLDHRPHDGTVRTRSACEVVVIFGPAVIGALVATDRREEVSALLRGTPANRPAPALVG